MTISHKPALLMLARGAARGHRAKQLGAGKLEDAKECNVTLRIGSEWILLPEAPLNFGVVCRDYAGCR